MYIKKKRPKPIEKSESIFETEKRLREEAKTIARNFTHTKPIKYLLK